MISVIPAGIIELFVESVFPIELLSLAIVAPIVEEVIKYRTTNRVTKKNNAFDEPIDGIIYACVLALWFATMENIFYVWDAYQAGNFSSVATIRAILSVPGHALFASMWGYAMSLQKFTKNKKKSFIFAWVSLAILLHAAMNFLTTISAAGAIGLIILLVFMRTLFHKKLKKLKTYNQPKASISQKQKKHST